MAIAGEVQPGPGEYGLAGRYEVCSSATHEPSFTIPGGRGIGNRECEPTIATFMLLPGTASRAACLTHHVGPAGERSPGPADYRPSSANVLPDKPAFTLAGRLANAGLKHSTPGPGAYAVRTRSKLLGSHPNAPSFSMPASGRGSEQGQKAPGPGGECFLCLVKQLFLATCTGCVHVNN